MQKIHEFTSRYGQPRIVLRDEEDYILEGPSEFLRAGEEFVDLQGGPFILVGSRASLALDIDDSSRIASVSAEDHPNEGWARVRIRTEES